MEVRWPGFCADRRPSLSMMRTCSDLLHGESIAVRGFAGALRFFSCGRLRSAGQAAPAASADAAHWYKGNLHTSSGGLRRRS